MLNNMTPMSKRTFTPALLVLLVFLLAQAASAIPTLIFGTTDVTGFSLTLLAVNLLAVLLCHLILRYIRFRTAFDAAAILWPPTLPALAAGILAAVGTSILAEGMELPDAMTQMFLAMSCNTLGFFVLVIAGPVCEELLFREAIEGEMLRRGASPMAAILVPAVAFSFAHLNLAQGLYALPLAILFGIIYFKTGNIVLTTLLHIANNGIVALQLRTLGPDSDQATFTHLLGPSAAIAIMLLAAVTTLLLTTHFWKHYPQPPN